MSENAVESWTCFHVLWIENFESYWSNH